MWKFIQNIKARRMNKIVDEVTAQIEEKMDFLVDEFVSKMNGALSNLSIDYDEMARYIDHSDVAYNMDASDIAEYVEIDSYDIAQNLDAYTVGYEILDDVVSAIDVEDVASNLNLDDIVESLNIDSRFEDAQLELIAEMENMISDAIDNLEITRG